MTTAKREAQGGGVIHGLIRVRNEARIIRETLDHMAAYCTGGIHVYDDASTDETALLCQQHPAVRKVIQGARWDVDRARAEFENRAAVLASAQEAAGPEDWLVYIDADERIEFDWKSLDELPREVIGIRMRLFDFYITQADTDKTYLERKWLGPEYRPILTVFRNLPTLSFHSPDQREVDLGASGRVIEAGYLRHYGKAESVGQWEETCTYYEEHFPMYAEKWRQRHGKAIHSTSDFGFPLIQWDQKELYGIPMTATISEFESRNRLQPSRPLSILIATHHLMDFTGTETYTLTLARSLKNRGHSVVVYARYLDRIRPFLEEASVEVVDDLAAIRTRRFDVAHVHHSLPAVEVRVTFPLLPIVLVCHGVLPFLEQLPPFGLGLSRILAVSEEVRDHLLAAGAPPRMVRICRNLADEGQFAPMAPSNTLRRAAILSGRMDEATISVIRDACQQSGISLRVRGGHDTELTPRGVPVFLNSVDLVFSLGRGVVETMLCGRVPVVMDYQGCDGLVTPGNIQELMKCNFSGRRFARRPTADELAEELKLFKPGLGEALRCVATPFFSASAVVQELERHYLEAMAGGLLQTLEPGLNLLEFISKALHETRNYTHTKTTRQLQREACRAEIRVGGSIEPEFLSGTLPDVLLAGADTGASEVPPECPVCEGEMAPALRKRDHIYFRCHQCGALFTPRIDPRVLYTENQAGGGRNTTELDVSRLDRIESGLGRRPERMIDFGCGGGQFVDFLMGNGISTGGVDQHTLLQLENLADEDWDAISAIEVIEHLYTPQAVFGEFVRILKPGGVVYLESSFDLGQDLLPWSYLDPAIGHCLIHTPASLAALAGRYGFKLSRINDNAYILAKPIAPVGGSTGVEVGRPGTPDVSSSVPCEVSIVIPAFNQAALTAQCLKSLYHTLPEGREVEVIVVDNGSTDNTPEVLKAWAETHPSLRILRNERNLLFAKACNQGADLANGEMLVFLNNDTEPCSGWLEKGLGVLREDERIGAIGARLLYPDGSLQHGGVEFIPNGQPGYRWWPAHRFLGIPGNDPRVSMREEVVAVTAACMFIRKSTFKAVGGFDDAYIMYFEDLDLCFKLRQAGLRILYEPGIVVVHHEGRSSPDRKAIDDLNRAAARFFFWRWGNEVNRLAESLQPEAFFYEPDWANTEWIEIVLSYLGAFAPGEPVALVLPLDPRKSTTPSLEAAETALVQLVVQTGRERFPDIVLIDQPNELLDQMRKYSRIQWVPGQRVHMGGLVGENGSRLCRARLRLTDPR